MRHLLLSALLLAAAPSFAVEFDSSIAQGMTLARAAAENAEDMALSTLYQRLFALQDKRREIELKADEAEFAIDDIVVAYYKYDDRITKAQLKAIAADPRHRDYPNNTESERLRIMASIREQLRIQRLGELELKRVARDTEEVKTLIAENLARRKPATP